MAVMIMLSVSCKSVDSQKVVNAESYGGIQFDVTTPVETAALPSDITKNTDTTPAVSGNDVSEEIMSSETEENRTETDAADITAECTSASASATFGATAETKKTTSRTTAETTEKTTAKTTEKTTSATEKTTVPTTAATTTPPPSSDGTNGYSALNHKQVKGVWISYLELNSILTGKSESAFRTAISKAYDNCAELGINTVYVHVRPFGDAIYDSELFPWSQFATGTFAKACSFDPLPIMIEEAHKRDISFHAWINPLRCGTTSQMQSISSDYALGKWYNDSSKNGKYIVKVGNYWYLNPAYDDVLRLVADGVSEITAGYDVDGIHIDDYFYPTTDAYFDSSAFSASSSANLSAFRTGNCNKLIEMIYGAMKAANKTAVFGASTQGNNNINRNTLYADVEAWCRAGTVDYLAPQIYYGFNNQALPFKTCVDEWCGIVSNTDIELYIGLAVYKCGVEDTWAGTGKNEWLGSSDIIKRQIEYSSSKKDCDGIILYSYNYVFETAHQNSYTKKEIEAIKPLL